ncbi:class I SAM-dependent methyltransferase [Octadecabacter sp.]|nr:class I SAM-dependent methyltransferase [Octadecabacter sp.]
MSVSVFNPNHLDIEIVVICTGADGKPLRSKMNWVSNPSVLKTKDLPLGPFQIVARTIAADPLYKSNAISGEILPDVTGNEARVAEDQLAQHRMDCAIKQTSKSVLTLCDPWVLPGAAAALNTRSWFPSAVYEGATSLYNEHKDYYRDPLEYFLTQIANLQAQGFEFITWHDVLDAPENDYSSAILLQFDLDAGPKSFHVIAERLVALGIRATAMVHWQARHWYHYDFSKQDAAKLQTLEARDWAIGYHHNCLTTLVGADEERLQDSELQGKAQSMMREEVLALREHFNIRTLTHHGGNVMNRSIPVPADLNITPVDRPDNPLVWKQVSNTFSDGSFTARPMPMRDWCVQQALGTGLRFMRCHPVKYGNYKGALDLPELTQTPSDIPRLADVTRKVKAQEDLSPLERQVAWISLRETSRSGTPLAELDFAKPLSRDFIRTPENDAQIEAFRARRRPGFLRQYPWSDGDPRVIWWHMLSSFCPAGRLLNVGAMPPDQKDETYAFVPKGSAIIEMDIDPDREPDILGDFCASDYQAIEQFDAVFLNGLPYFSDPKAALKNAWVSLKSGGVLLIGAAGASQPERGGLYRPDVRPIWRQGEATTSGESLSLLTTLWSFDALSVAQMMDGWHGQYSAESLAHYWFVHAQKGDS